MEKMRKTVFIIALSVFVATPLIGGRELTITKASAQERTVKVSYAPIPGGEYRIDPAHSTIGFSIRHLEINWVEGRFKNFAGVIRFDDKNLTRSSVEFNAKIESIDTGVEPRDKHLRTADFFDAAKYPELTFKSTRIERRGKNNYVLHGDFNLKGVTKQIQLPFTITGAIKDQRGNTRFGIEARTKIDRRDYGITYGKELASGGFDIGHEVNIALHLEALQPAAKPAGQ